MVVAASFQRRNFISLLAMMTPSPVLLMTASATANMSSLFMAFKCLYTSPLLGEKIGLDVLLSLDPCHSPSHAIQQCPGFVEVWLKVWLLAGVLACQLPTHQLRITEDFNGAVWVMLLEP